LLCAIGIYLWVRVCFVAVQVVQRMLHFEASSHTYLFRHILGVVLFIIIFGIMLTHRIYRVVNRSDEDNSFLLVLLHTIVLGGQGIVDFVCFGVTKDNFLLWYTRVRVRQNYKELAS